MLEEKSKVNFMHRLFRSLALISLTWVIPGNAYFYRGRIWEKTNEWGEKQYIVGLGDIHEDNEQEKTQFQQLMERIPKNGFIIIEDPYHQLYPDSLNTAFANTGFCWGPGGLFTNITRAAHLNTIPYKNIEHRFFPGVGQWGDWLEGKTQITCGQAGDIGDKIFSIDQQLLGVRKSQNHAGWEHAYAPFIQKTESNLICFSRLITLLRNGNNINQVAQRQIVNNNMNYLLGGAQRFDSDGSLSEQFLSVASYVGPSTPLVDLGILQTIYEHRDCPAIFICTGAAHIRNIEGALTQLGYAAVPEKAHGPNYGFSGPPPLNVREFLEPIFSNPPMPVVQKQRPPKEITWSALGSFFYKKYQHQIGEAAGIAGGICFWGILLSSLARR